MSYAVEVSVRNENKSLYRIVTENTKLQRGTTDLFISELAFGTRYYDERIAEGLSVVLDLNGYENEIDRLVIGGGIFPEFPPLYSVGNAERMRLLGVDSEKEAVPSSPRIEQFLEHVLGKKEAARLSEYREKWLEGKINSWQDCVRFAARQMATILSGINVGEIHYCQGEEDKFNQKYEEELKVNRLAKQASGYIKDLKSDLGELEKQQGDCDKSRAVLEDRLEQFGQERKVVQLLYDRARRHKKRAKKWNVERFIKKQIEEHHRTLFYEVRTEKQKAELIKYFKNNPNLAALVRLRDDMGAAMNLAKGELKGLNKDYDSLEPQVETLREEISALERQLGQGDAITIFTKRAHIKPIEAEWIYKIVKDEYIKDIMSCFPEDQRDRVRTHISGSAKLKNIPLKVIDNEGKEREDVLEEADLDMYGDILVIHNTRFKSNTPSLSSISEAEQEILWRKSLEKITCESDFLVPKTIVTAHAAGGFAVTRINSNQEFKNLDNNYREDPNIVTVMQLPVFQSTDKLLKFYDKRMNKTWGIKRFASRLHGAAVVFRTTLEDGSELYDPLDTAALIEIADLQRKMNKHNVGSDEYTSLKEELQLKCSRTLKVRVMMCDGHVGAPNFPNRPTQYQAMDRSLNYIEENYRGFIDEFFLTEMVDGVLEHTWTDRSFEGKPLSQIEVDVENFLKDHFSEKGLTSETVGEALMYVKNEYATAMAQNAVPNLTTQYEILRPYVERIVKLMVGKLITVSGGNHPRCRETGANEARELEGLIRECEDEKTIQILRADNLSRFGGQGGIQDEKVIVNGRVLSTGKSVGIPHKPGTGRNLHPRTARKIQLSGWNYDVFLAGDQHRPLFSYVNGTLIAIGPACEGPTPYIEDLSVKTSPYGFLVTFTNAAETGHPANSIRWGGAHLVLDNTLELPEYRDNGLDTIINDIARGMISDTFFGLSLEGQKSALEEALGQAGGNVTKAAAELGISYSSIKSKIRGLEVATSNFRKERDPDKEKTIIEEALRETKGNVNQAYRLTDFSRGTFRRRMKEFGISADLVEETAES